MPQSWNECSPWPKNPTDDMVHVQIHRHNPCIMWDKD